MSKSKWEWSGQILNLQDNISLKDTDTIISQAVSRKESIYSIQFWGSFDIKNQTFELINNYILTQFPDCSFRIRDDYPLSPAFSNMEFLDQLPNLTSFRCEINPTISLKPIHKLPRLKKLTLMSEKPIDITEITTIETITDLTLYGKIKNIEKISVMSNLVKLEFWRQTLKSLEFLKPLSHLKELSFVLGGTKNLKGISGIGQIEKISFTRVRELEIENLLPINELTSLKELHLEQLPKLTDLNWLVDKRVNVKVVECNNYNKASS